MICPECNQKLVKNEKECPSCGYPIHEEMLKFSREKIRRVKKILTIICVLALCVGIWATITGFNKKNNYYNSEYSISLNENAYVGGDAYNYIINGTYFTGYLTIAASMYVVSAITGSLASIYYLYDIEMDRKGE